MFLITLLVLFLITLSSMCTHQFLHWGPFPLFLQYLIYEPILQLIVSSLSLLVIEEKGMGEVKHCRLVWWDQHCVDSNCLGLHWDISLSRTVFAQASKDNLFALHNVKTSPRRLHIWKRQSHVEASPLTCLATDTSCCMRF